MDTCQPGTLFIVATPMGNLADMTYRGVETLKQVNLIAAEDTRHSAKLLSHYGISTPLVSCHEHNEDAQTTPLIDKLKQGNNIALISDAGTPCISDPGYLLVSRAAKEGLRIVPIPGCSAVTAGLSASGLPTDAFLFLGFLPKKSSRMRQVLELYANETATLVIYESPKRITRTLREASAVLGDRQSCLARELTKIHEELIRGPLTAILNVLEAKARIRGEMVLFVHGSKKEKPGSGHVDDDRLEALILERLAGSDPRTADLARAISQELNIKKKQVYDRIVKLKSRTN